MTRHQLKLEADFFHEVSSGRKNFECRKDDRGFKEGDELLLLAWDPIYKCYVQYGKWNNPMKAETDDDAAWIEAKVKYILRGEKYGVMKGCCCMAIDVISYGNGGK